MSSDLQDPLFLIDQMYAKINKGFEIVWAKRKSIDNNWLANICSKIYAELMRHFIIANFPENGFDVAMFGNKVKKEINANIESNSSLFLQIMTLGFKSTTIIYNKSVRKTGTSKWTLAKKIKLLIDSFAAFSYAPLRFISIMGIFLSAAGFGWAAYVLLRTILRHDLASGWPALLAILMIGFGMTNISLGIIAEYLWRTFDAARNRQVYIIEEIIKLNK